MIVIPMAGLSSRFFKAGYDKPKYMLKIGGEFLFDHSVKSFSNYFEYESFLFIVRDVYDTESFVRERAINLGIKNFYIHVLTENTLGQAETVTLGLLSIKNLDLNNDITIFNIDTFRPGFKFIDLNNDVSGYLEVFIGEGDNWSFVQPISNSEFVLKTSEKRRISNLCSTGLYFFSRAKDYIEAFEKYSSLPKEEWDGGELYIAPMYNILITQGKKIQYNVINVDEVIFCGTPEEYELLEGFI